MLPRLPQTQRFTANIVSAGERLLSPSSYFIVSRDGYARNVSPTEPRTYTRVMSAPLRFCDSDVDFYPKPIGCDESLLHPRPPIAWSPNGATDGASTRSPVDCESSLQTAGSKSSTKSRRRSCPKSPFSLALQVPESTKSQVECVGYPKTGVSRPVKSAE